MGEQTAMNTVLGRLPLQQSRPILAKLIFVVLRTLWVTSRLSWVYPLVLLVALLAVG